MAITAQVKGVVLRGILKDVKENYRAGIPAFLEAMPREIREKDFAHNIVHGVWYSYDSFTALLETFRREIGRGRQQSIEELGARAAVRDFGTMLKIYAAVSSPHRVGQHSTAVWTQRFKDAGAMTLTDKTDRSFRLVLEGFRGIHELNCAFLTGYGLGAGRRWEKSYKVVHDVCVKRSGQTCSWLSTW